MPAEALSQTSPDVRRFVLVGVESAGKSALFRNLSGESVGDEANFRGSTIACREAEDVLGLGLKITDTPGIQTRDDRVSTQLTLGAMVQADVLGIVVRGFNAVDDLKLVLEFLGDESKNQPIVVVVTFRDRAPGALDDWTRRVSSLIGVPVVAIDGRNTSELDRHRIKLAIAGAQVVFEGASHAVPALPTNLPPPSLLDRPRVGMALALLLFVAVFGVPVYLAHVLAASLQTVFDTHVLAPVVEAVSRWAEGAPFVVDALVGGYGIITLGAYSFLWAFPVVVLVGVSMALLDETGLRDRMAHALDPLMRRIGLTGRDLSPVLGGFGCNVVAVMQTRSCSKATRGACVSLISIGSSCSYQLGAAISVFTAAGYPSLALALVAGVLLTGLLHTRLWSPKKRRGPSLQLLGPHSFGQRPTASGLFWRVRATCKQFLLQAMPIFLLLCLASTVLVQIGGLAFVQRLMSPLLEAVLGLPETVAPAIVFSILRKDGLLLLNQDSGAIASAIGPGALFLTVFIGSTIAPCIVTLYTVARELGTRAALGIAGKQLLTALAVSVAIAIAIRKTT